MSARFGSVRTAVEAAGLAQPIRRVDPVRRWDLEAIADAMRDHAERTGQAPRRSDWQHAGEGHPAASTVYRVAGSWQRALEAAGFPRVGTEPRQA